MIKIESIAVATIRLEADYSNALVSFSELTGSIVAIAASRGDGSPRVAGYGFGSIGRYAHSEMIRERFTPRVLDADPMDYNDASGLIDPVKLARLMRRNEKPGGHGERTAAIGAVDMAAWDLCAKLEGRPLFRILADRFNGGTFDSSVQVYAAGGYYYDDGGLGRLRSELEAYLEMGFESVKIKVGGASIEEDLERIKLATELVESTERVAVDANGRFDKSEALVWARALEPLGLRWFEEPVDPLDYNALQSVCEVYPHAIATGENLFAVQDFQNLLRYGGMRADIDVLQMDPGLSYGVSEYAEMLDVMESSGWSRRRCFPHGGNLFNLHVAQGLQIGGTEVYPGVFAPLGGFGDLVTIHDGRATAPELPGIGWESKPKLMNWFHELKNG